MAEDTRTNLFGEEVEAPPVFSKTQGRKLRDAGIKQATTKRRERIIEQGRQAMRLLALSRDDRTVSSDEVHEWLVINGHGDNVLGNAIGGFFRKQVSWVRNGDCMSRRIKARGRRVSKWKYVGH